MSSCNPGRDLTAAFTFIIKRGNIISQAVCWALHICTGGFVRQMSPHLTGDPTHDSGPFLDEAPQLAGGQDKVQNLRPPNYS